MATCDVNSLAANAACFACQPPGVWPILELQLLCEIASALGAPISGGGSSSPSVALGNGAINAGPQAQRLATPGQMVGALWVQTDQSPPFQVFTWNGSAWQ